MRYFELAVAAIVVGFCVTGCNWSSTDNANSWNDSYSWVDFGGTYRSPDGSTVVSGFQNEEGSSPGETRVTGEVLGQTTGSTASYAGLTVNAPVAPGSVSISVSAITYTDDGNGLLVSGTAGANGSFNYATGSWRIDLGGAGVADGTPILGNYRYYVGGSTGTISPGNSGNPVYTLTVSQTGNKLIISDNRGLAYGGQITGVSVPNGDETGRSSGDVIMNYDVSGNGVRMVGTFQAQYVAPGGSSSSSGSSTTGGTSTTGAEGLLGNREIQGTWIEPGVTGDIYGLAGSQLVFIDLPIATDPVLPANAGQ